MIVFAPMVQGISYCGSSLSISLVEGSATFVPKQQYGGSFIRSQVKSRLQHTAADHLAPQGAVMVKGRRLNASGALGKLSPDATPPRRARPHQAVRYARQHQEAL